MHSWIRRKLKFVLFYNYKFTKMNKQERVTFVINTLKEFYPSIPVPLDHKDPYTDCCFTFGPMHGCSREPNYAFTFAKADNPYDMIKCLWRK
jgi:endonuclease-3